MNAVRGLLIGGALTMIGASLPWLTLYAGLQLYGGLSGMYGWVIFACGALAVGASYAMRMRPRWLWFASAVLGVALMTFSAWLFAGLMEIVRRPESVMLVPRAGPGLLVVCAGAAIIVAGALAEARVNSRAVARVETR